MVKFIRCSLLFLTVGVLYECPGRSQTAPAVAQVVCALGSTASPYNPYLDQRPTADAMELAGKVNAALVSMCRPNCPGLALFRNSTAPNVMLVTDAGLTKILYKTEFFTSVNNTLSDCRIQALPT